MAEPPLKDPSQLVPRSEGSRGKQKVRLNRKQPIPRSARSRLPYTPSAGSSISSRPSASPQTGPRLEVLSADAGTGLPRENALLAINLLVFELMHFHAVEREKATPEQASLVPLVRRGGGGASLLSLCVLYTVLARSLGVDLQLVSLSPPPMIKAHGPPFLLLLPETRDHQELFVDVAAGGRLRQRHDLSNFFRHGELAKAPAEQLRQFVVPLDGKSLCVELVNDLEAACRVSNQLAQAAFWKVQREVLLEEQARAERERAPLDT